jgi:hypothetical protein
VGVPKQIHSASDTCRTKVHSVRHGYPLLPVVRANSNRLYIVNIEQRLYAVVREAVNDRFATFGDLAAKIYKSEPPEFSYTRLDEEYVMKPESISTYVSLLHFIGLLRKGEDGYECILDEEPTPEGLEELVTQKSVAALVDAGFRKGVCEQSIRKMLRLAKLPSLRAIYETLSLDMTEAQFIHLTSIGGVRRHFGFTLVTRRVLLPTEGLDE